MRSAIARLTFALDESRHFKLPGDGSPSLLYVFGPDQKLGARAYSPRGQDFEPGSSQPDVRLDFWADDPWTDVVQAGVVFTIWYGSDVGNGVIERLI